MEEGEEEIFDSVIEAKIIFETNQPNILDQENFFLIFDGR